MNTEGPEVLEAVPNDYRPTKNVLAIYIYYNSISTRCENMPDILFSCPECKSQTKITIGDAETTKLRERIKAEGRSPTLIVRCPKGHELLVTLYNSENGLSIRDVVVPVRSAERPSEADWVRKAFGG